MRIELFNNGVGIMSIIDDKFYVEDEEWGCYKEVTIKEFIESLKAISYVYLTTWDKEVKNKYLELVEYTRKLEKR